MGGEMHVIADTSALVEDGIISHEAATEMQARGREAMVSMAINVILFAGILFATFGLIFWLANAVSVAICGAVLLAGGLFILARTSAIYQMLGNAAALIGAGMLIAGLAIELIENYDTIAGWVMLAGGALVTAIAFGRFVAGGLTSAFVQGSIGLMGVALHLAGLAILIMDYNLAGLWPPLMFLYATAALIGSGWLLDVRLVTALAIVPFAQVLDTGTLYFHAAYVFASPEPTLSLIQMALAVTAALWIAAFYNERTGRHAQIFATLAFITGNLCALVGSLWGDWIGETIWGVGSRNQYASWDDLEAARDAFQNGAIFISPNVFSVLWALALVAVITLAAKRSNRALFNAGVTFASIHAYTQMFETFADESLAFVIGGFGAVALAWVVWRLNTDWLKPTEGISS
jgi:hypothetical protein